MKSPVVRPCLRCNLGRGSRPIAAVLSPYFQFELNEPEPPHASPTTHTLQRTLHATALRTSYPSVVANAFECNLAMLPANGSAAAASPAGKEAANGAPAGPGIKRRRSAPDIHAEEARRAVPDDDEERMAKMQAACSTLLECLGEDTSREGLVKTPKRMAEALLACTRGYSQSLSSIVNGAVFEENHHEMILVKDIEIHSLCEHHMVPFTGKVHIAYIPRSKVSQ